VFYNDPAYVVFGTEQKNSTSLFLPWMLYKTSKGPTALTPEIDCHQMAMGLPLGTSVAFLTALVKSGPLGGISGMSLLPPWG
jgi:hypothetical protein